MATVTMMVLLSLIAVGLLQLSTATLRSSQAGQERLIAESNARLALAMALGELQRTAGSDQRITAPAQINEPNAPRGLTGVWQAWRPDGATDGYSKSDKDSRFLGWLVSGQNSSSNPSPDLPQSSQEQAILIGEGTLGNNRSSVDPLSILTATRVPVRNSNASGKGKGGSIAWAVMDEGIKARLDLPSREGERRNDLATQVMAANHASRDAAWKTEGLEDAQDAFEEPGSPMATFGQGDFRVGKDTLNEFRHDYSISSRGLMTSAASGGFKTDLSLLFDTPIGSRGSDTLPAPFSNVGLYPARTGLEDHPANPRWSQLHKYASLYKDLRQVDGQLGLEVTVDADQALGDARRNNPEIDLTTQPTHPLLTPAVARIELVFSLITRNAHGGWPTRINNPRRPYLLHMMYSPIVTLYNPYNVPISFDEIEVEFEDLPIGFRFFRNGEAMTTRIATLNQLYVSQQTGNQKKSFGFTLKEEIDSRSRAKAVIEPGATRIYGVNVSPNWTWAQDRVGDGNTIFDWRDDKTGAFTCGRGWSQGMGFDIDWLAPESLKTGSNDNPAGVIACGPGDLIDVEFGPAAPLTGQGSFFVNLSIPDRRRPVTFSRFEVEYGSVDSLKQSLELKTVDGVTFPQRLERPVQARQIFETDTRPIAEYVNSKPFAVFSLRGKTTFDSSEWVRSWTDSSPTARAASLNLSNQRSQAPYPVEVALRPVDPNNGEGSFDIDAADRGFYHGGHSSQFGTKIAAAYEIPYAPLQSLAQLRHVNLNNIGQPAANPYTVGESRLHPMLAGDNFTSSSSLSSRSLLDHTWLSNDALWDDYFFSTITAYEGPAFQSSSRSRTKVIEDFLMQEEALFNDRFTVRNLSEEERQEASNLLNDSEGWRYSAQYLLQEGTFNVNSTSVEAWKAVLGGLESNTLNILRLEGDSSDQSGTFRESETQVAGAAFPRVRRPLENSSDQNGGDVDRRMRWRGFRELDANGQEAALTQLAENIVEVVQERGPFLSLAEFVNRQIGSSRDEATRKGAIQSAIDRSDINADFAEQDGIAINSATAASYGYTSSAAVEGYTTAGYPGELSQGDILSVIGSRISARSDTFTIRAYGDATDQSGRILSRAWCEATVQRVPDFVDHKQPAATATAELNDLNSKFGRRFNLTSFRWLSEEEV